MRIHIQTARYPVWLLWLAGIPLAIVASLLAIFFFTFFVIFFALAALAVGLRLWWLRRKLRRAPPASAVLDAEYEVIGKSRSGSERDRG